MIEILAEVAADIPAIRRVNELAFGRVEEADLVDALRVTANPLISLVAIRDMAVVGHVLFSPVTVVPDQACVSSDGALLLGLGPMAVLPEWQNQGIGSELVEAGLRACRESGAAAVVVLGHPEFYPRFGFVAASRYGLRCEYDVPDEVFMVQELVPGALVEGGLVRYHSAFAGVDE